MVSWGTGDADQVGHSGHSLIHARCSSGSVDDDYQFVVDVQLGQQGGQLAVIPTVRDEISPRHFVDLIAWIGDDHHGIDLSGE
jgi:hypothetical protein